MDHILNQQLNKLSTYLFRILNLKIFPIRKVIYLENLKFCIQKILISELIRKIYLS